MSTHIKIHSKIKDYDVYFEETSQFIDDWAANTTTCFIVDENVWKLYSSTLLGTLPRENVIIVPIHENNKNLDTVQKLYNRLVEYPAKRNLTVVTIGGGILQDISGFAVSTIYRGIDWIFIPTTLLAQADSCIGSKTSLNYKNYKNLIGTFYPPNKIYIHSQFLKTLSKSDFYSGFGEVIKLHLMGGANHHKSLLEVTPAFINREPEALFTAIHRSLKIKLSYMEGDEFDHGRRNLLNYGHDFGHAIESTSNFEIPHGQGIIIGMMAANIISRERGILSSDLEREISESILIPSLITKPSPEALHPDSIISAMKKDKKRTGDKLALIMADNNYNFTRTNDLAETEVIDTLAELLERIGC